MLCAILLWCAPVPAQSARDLRLATTTSTENSGLLAAILPQFEKKYDITVRVISVGSGKAMKLGENSDVDVVLVHSRADEDRFVAAGFGVGRRDVMVNDFILAGPGTDPAGARGTDILAAFRRIAAAGSRLVSRGDDSGTDKMEKSCWRDIGIDPATLPGYLSAGPGDGRSPDDGRGTAGLHPDRPRHLRELSRQNRGVGTWSGLHNCMEMFSQGFADPGGTARSLLKPGHQVAYG